MRTRTRVGLACGGLLLFFWFAAWLLLQKRGPQEFGYAPFQPDGLPWAAMRGFTYEQLWSHVARLVLLGPALLLLAFALKGRLRLPAASDPLWPKLARAGVVLSVAGMGLIMIFVLRGRAICDDELVYRMQSAILSRGWLSAPDVGYVPVDVFTVPTLGGYSGKYLPGEALVQIPGLSLGLPALSHLLLAALALSAWYQILRQHADPAASAVGVLALGLSPTFMLTGATGHSQLTALSCVVFAGFGLLLAARGRSVLGAVICAAATGYCFATRPQVAIPACGVLVLAFGWRAWKERELRALSALVLVGALSVLPVLLYNRAVGGGWLKLPWFLQCVQEKYGFGRVFTCDAFSHTPRVALENLAVLAVRFNGWWLGLPCSLLAIAIWWKLGRPFGDKVWLWLGGAVLAFELAYYSTGISDTGPMYHVELLLPGSMLLAHAFGAARERWPELTAPVLVVHLVLGTGSFLGEHGARLSRLVHTIHDDSDRVLASIEEPRAIVLHEIWLSEVRRAGWVMDAFPKRFRDPEDRIVTLPRPPRHLLDRVMKAYPGRACYYFHRKPESGDPELLRCSDAGQYLSRGLVNVTEDRELWLQPTAYLKTGFDPATQRRERNRGEKPCFPCCVFDEWRRYGDVPNPKLECQP